MEILSKREKDKLSQTRRAFKEACSGDLGSFEPAKQKGIQEHVSCVEAAIDSFGSATFIVSSIGMLKSGKSTLVNLFARDDLASPTGYGYDTTLRPALIMNSEDDVGHIEIWFSNNPTQPLSKSTLDKLFSHLRGIGDVNNDVSTVPQEVTCHAYDLNKANLLNALCKEEREAENNMLPAEPILVVVKVPRHAESLLSSSIMILDTPGLDSGRSEWTAEDSERYSWIISNSDLLLFLQSSVSPLNVRAAKILHDIREHNPSIPVWLVQNEMVLKPWLPRERIKVATEEQRKRASEMFNRISRAFKQVNANLGKADSAIFDESLSKSEREELLADSQFKSMEKNIQEDLWTNIGPIRRANCKSNVLREVKQMRTFVDQLIGDKKSAVKSLDSDILEMEKFKNNLKDILLDPPQRQKFLIVEGVGEIETLETIPFRTNMAIRALQNMVDRCFTKESYSSSEIEKIIRDTKDKLIERIREQLTQTKLQHFILNIHGVEHKNNIVKFFKDKFSEYVDNLIKINYQPPEHLREKTNQLVDECCSLAEMPAFPDGVNVDVKDLDHIKINVSEKDCKLNTVGKILTLGLKKELFSERDKREAEGEFVPYFDEKRKCGKFIDLINSCESTMKENLLSWLNIDAYQAMRQDFIDKITEQVDADIADLKNALAERKNEAAVLQNMLNGCSALEKNMELF